METNTDNTNPNTTLLAKLVSVSLSFEHVRTRAAQGRRVAPDVALIAGARNALARRGILVTTEIESFKNEDISHPALIRPIEAMARVTFFDAATGERLSLKAAAAGAYPPENALAQVADKALRNCLANLFGLLVDPVQAWNSPLVDF